MRWSLPVKGKREIVTRFLLLPVVCDGEIRWLEDARFTRKGTGLTWKVVQWQPLLDFNYAKTFREWADCWLKEDEGHSLPEPRRPLFNVPYRPTGDPIEDGVYVRQGIEEDMAKNFKSKGS